MRYYFLILIIPAILILSACNSKEQKIDIPDIGLIHSNIFYLDSLLQSQQVDSIATMATQAENLISDWSNRARSPEDEAILDSVSAIISISNEFLRFCIDSRTNIELLRQDIVSAEAQYKSGKIKTGQYIRSLLESEQILVDINNRYEDERMQVITSLHNISNLQALLNPLPVQE